MIGHSYRVAESTATRSPGLHPLGDQSECNRTDLLGDLCGRHVRPRAVDEALQDHVVGVVAFMGVDGADDVVVLADFKRCGNTELTHDLRLSMLVAALPGPA